MKFTFFRATSQDSVNRRILRAALTVGSLTLVVKGGVIVKELVVARSFGRNDSLDAFLFAFMLPSFAVTLVMGAISAATVPVLVETREKEGVASAQRLLSTVALLSSAALVVLAALLGLLQPWYLPPLAHSFKPEKLQLTRELLYILLPWLVFSGLATFMAAVLNAVEKFAVPALVPLLTPLAIMGAIAAGIGYGAVSLAVGTVAGGLCEVSLLWYLARKHRVLGAARWHGLDRRVRQVLSQAAPLMAGTFLMGATPVVDQSMAARLAPGSVAALSYGSKVLTGIIAIGATALGTAVLPYFSRMAGDNDWRACRDTLKRLSALVLAITVPLTVALIVVSKPLVRLLFQHGAFTNLDTDVVSRVQTCYFIQIPLYALCMLFVRFVSAVRRNHLLLYASAVNLVVDVVMNLALMRILGVAGIALSSSVVVLGSLLFLSASSIRLLTQRLPGVAAPAHAQADR